MLKAGVLEEIVVAVAGDDAPVVRCAELGARTGAPAAEAHVLVCDTGELDEAFDAARDAANAWIDAERGGKIVLVAPRGDAPLQAALENLARTLSIEWARYGITPTAILPGATTTDGEIAELVAFLASPAGDYYSGCAFSLGRA